MSRQPSWIFRLHVIAADPAKIKLSDVPGELIDQFAQDDVELVCELAATNEKGQPATGTIRPPWVSWRART